MLLYCKCGNTLSDISVPNDIEYIAYSDREWADIIKDGNVYFYNIPEPKYDVWRCPKCERLYLLNEKGEVVKVYHLEDSEEDG